MSSVKIETIEVKAVLSEAERHELDHLLAHYPVPSGANIDALKIIQKARGWVSDESLKALAEYMEVPLAELESVATFYNLIFRKPVGQSLVHPCNGMACDLMGGRRIRESIKQQLGIDEGQTTEDGELTLISLPCLGACDKAPVVLTGNTLHQDTLHQRVQLDDVRHVLETARKQAKQRVDAVNSVGDNAEEGRNERIE